MKRIVLFVEGEGEADAAPRLIKRLLTEQNAWDAVSLDEHPFRVQHVSKLLKDDCREWKRKLAASRKRPNLGAVMLLLDGDAGRIGPETFCAATVARALAGQAKTDGAGATYSVAVVFAVQEYESWLIPGVAALAGKRLPDGRLIHPDTRPPEGDLELAPRNAKGWLAKVIEGGYKQTRDQAQLTDMIDLESIRTRNLRSFRRVENAVSQIVSAIRNGKPCVTPL